MTNSTLLSIIVELLGWIFSMIMVIMATLAAIHVAQHVERPEHKLVWIILFAFIPIIGSMLYYFTKYSRFKQIGKGGLICKQAIEGTKFFKLSEAEMAGAVTTDGEPNTSKQNLDDCRAHTK